MDITKNRPIHKCRRAKQFALPTKKAIKESLTASPPHQSCRVCIYFKDESGDVFEAAPTCWCTTAECIIQWAPSRKRCRFWADGRALQRAIAEEMKWAKASIQQWLKSRKGK